MAGITCLTISTLILVYLLGLSYKVDLEKTSIMNVGLVLCSTTISFDIKFYLSPSIHCFDVEIYSYFQLHWMYKNTNCGSSLCIIFYIFIFLGIFMKSNFE